MKSAEPTRFGGSDSAPFVLVRAKLQRPRLGGDLVIRGRLFNRLDDGLNRNLTLVSAPAGFGKTTLLATWLRQRGHAAAWVSLDKNDDHVVGFVSDVAAAINSQFPNACRGLSTILQMPQPVPPELLASLLSNELAELPDDLVLVLDDYQFVQDNAVHVVINELVSRPPKHLHLVIAARFDPPISLARLRGIGQVQEIRANELRFEEHETSDFLARALGPQLDPAAVASLQARTEGWVTGLRLAALSLTDEPDAVGFARSFSGDNHQIAEFLLDEVLLRLPSAMRNFLLTTSIVDRMCAPLCDALLAGGSQAPSATALLDSAQRASLFITALDDDNRWFRYHHLFRRLLQRELHAHFDGQAITALHKRASAWFASQDLIEEAVVQQLAAGDALAAASLVEEWVHPLLNRESWRTLQRLLELLPASVRERPRLVVARTWLLNFTVQGASIPTLLGTLEAPVGNDHDPASRALRADIDALWSLSRALDGEAVVGLEHARQAISRMPAEHAYARGFAEFYLAVHFQFAGRWSDAVEMLHRAQVECGDKHPSRSARILLALAWGELAAGNLYGVEQIAHGLRRTGEDHHLPVTLSWAHYLLGLLAYEWDDLPAACEQYTRAVQIREHANFKTLRDATLGLALANHARGDRHAAHHAVDELQRFADAVPGPHYRGIVRSFQVRLLLLEGDVLGATRHLSRIDQAALRPVSTFELEVPPLTEVQALAGQPSTATLSTALCKADDQVRWHTNRHESLFAIRALALKALVLHLQGQTPEALTVLQHAIVMAAPGRFVRSFVDLGPPMQDLLGQLNTDDSTAIYMSDLLGRFPTLVDTSAPDATRGELTESLSAREAEVLDLLVRRFSNKEIAQQLKISDLTVKRHTVSLYQKLRVKGRQAAVARAVNLGLIAAN